MTKDNRDNTTTTEEQKLSPDKRAILGHHAALRGLNEWHQVCFQWCQQQQVKERCSMYCFKHNTITPKQDPPLPLSSSSSSTTTTDGDGIRNHARKTLKHLMCQLADTLNDYSIVVVTGTSIETDKYIEATEQEYHTQKPMPRDRNVREINLNKRMDAIMENTELMIEKTYSFSKSLLDTWKANNKNKWISQFDYSDTFETMKNRAIKIIDVAQGKYDDLPNKRDPDDNSDPDA
ncbi:hypothetical protein [Absidia glauca]|uniref:Uncharacterized protein n=1 Tax=Absidia glauca TaxID=4829 RepID=A0A168PEV7_ABSGL|nr:hypothetical protein [Absidia glauca]